MVRIHKRLHIPDHEIWFTASRGGGPGGQHVNKAATRVTLHFDVGNSPSLSDRQRRRLERVLGNRINNDGILQLSSHEHRSQAANREEVTERFARLVAKALRRRPKRKKTRPTKGSKERRLRNKKHRAEKKRLRRKVRRPEE